MSAGFCFAIRKTEIFNCVEGIGNMILDIIESLGDGQVYLNLFNKLQRGRSKKAQHIEFLQLTSNVSKDTTQVENDGLLSGADAF